MTFLYMDICVITHSGIIKQVNEVIIHADTTSSHSKLKLSHALRYAHTHNYVTFQSA